MHSQDARLIYMYVFSHSKAANSPFTLAHIRIYLNWFSFRRSAKSNFFDSDGIYHLGLWYLNRIELDRTNSHVVRNYTWFHGSNQD